MEDEKQIANIGDLVRLLPGAITTAIQRDKILTVRNVEDFIYKDENRKVYIYWCTLGTDDSNTYPYYLGEFEVLFTI